VHYYFFYNVEKNTRPRLYKI